jgi:hypothetical protein
MFPKLVEHAFIQQKRIQTMNQQPRYLRKIKLEDKKNNNLSNLKESVLSTKKFQDMPDVLELTRIMLVAISPENSGNIPVGERHAFYNFKKEIFSLTNMRN